MIPRLVNDRLLLGMKGTFSELELSITSVSDRRKLCDSRPAVAICTLALRWAMCDPPAIGWRWTLIAGFEGAIDLVFRRSSTRSAAFARVAVWLRQEGIHSSRGLSTGKRGRTIAWHLPRYNSVHRILTNPVYAGAYVFGRTVSSTS